MSYLVAAVFNDELRAQQAMSELVRFYKPRPDLDNFLLLTWNGRDPIALQSQNLADRVGGGWGVLWGSFLRTVIAESSEIGDASGGLRAEIELRSSQVSRQTVKRDWVAGFDISGDFFRDLAAMITPGRSAIFFVSRSATLEPTAKVTHGYGGTLLSSRLSGQQLAKISKFVRNYVHQ